MTLWLRAILFAFPLFASAEYKFSGRHFLASYLDCDREAISNVSALMEAMNEAVRASGATLLDESHFIFPPDGLTMVFLLSESHASIHTYPEFGACFVDLFTCGDHCQAQGFHDALKAYLQPHEVNVRYLSRNEEIAELPLDIHDPHL